MNREFDKHVCNDGADRYYKNPSFFKDSILPCLIGGFIGTGIVLIEDLITYKRKKRKKEGK